MDRIILPLQATALCGGTEAGRRGCRYSRDTRGRAALYSCPALFASTSERLEGVSMQTEERKLPQIRAQNSLIWARKQAGLTQEQLAEKLGTKQEAISRWETDTEGSISLRNYVEFVQACGMVPFITVMEEHTG
jgi:DNA-binding XRE family transcriptional regulator